MQNHELALRDYILGMKYKDIALKYNVSIDTVKSWKKRYSWNRDKPVRGTQKSAHSAPKKEKVCKGVQEEKKSAGDELTDQEKLFCYHFVRTHNKQQASLLAGYGGPNKSKESAAVQSIRLFQRQRVRDEVERLSALFRQEIHVDILDFLEFCMKIVGADIGDYLEFRQEEVPVMAMYGPVMIKNEQTGKKEMLMQKVNTVMFNDSGVLDTTVIQEVKQGKDGVSVKLADKKWAWEQLAKYFDWLPDKWQRSIEERKVALSEKKASIDDKEKSFNITIKRKAKPDGNA